MGSRIRECVSQIHYLHYNNHERRLKRETQEAQETTTHPAALGLELELVLLVLALLNNLGQVL